MIWAGVHYNKLQRKRTAFAMEEDLTSNQAGTLKSARKTRGGHQASTTQIRSRVSDFVRRIEATNDKSAEVRSEALAYLKS